MSRPDLTIVANLSGRAARLDTWEGRAPAFQAWADRNDGLMASLDAALRKGRVGPKVFVLTDEVRLVALQLAAKAIAGLSDTQLSGASSFEAEAVGGLAAASSVTSAVRQRVPEGEDLIVAAQMDREAVAAVAGMVRKRGGRLAGIAHPGGLPRRIQSRIPDEPTTEAAGSAWLRVELWRDEVILVEGGKGRVSWRPLGVTPASQWQRQLPKVLGSQANGLEVEMLAAPGVVPPPMAGIPADASPRWASESREPAAGDDRPVRLDEPERLRCFLIAWSELVGSAMPGVPLLRAPRLPSSRWTQASAGLAAVASVAVGIWFLESRARARIGEVQERVAHAEQDQRGLEQARKHIEELKKQRAALQFEADRARSAADANAAHTPASLDLGAHLSALLSELEFVGGGDWVVSSITHRSPTLTVAGMAVSGQAATGLAKRLSHRLSETWTVSPAVIKPEMNGADIAWRFLIDLTPRFDAPSGGRP